MFRALARPLLATWFVYGGIESVLEPERRAASVAPMVDPALKELGVDDKVTTTDLVKAHGALSIGAAALMAVSRAPRTAALLLTGLSAATTALTHPFWTVEDEAEKEAEKEQFLKNLSLVGGVMLASTVGHSARHIARKKKAKEKAKEKAAVAKAKDAEVKAAKREVKRKKISSKAAA